VTSAVPLSLRTARLAAELAGCTVLLARIERRHAGDPALRRPVSWSEPDTGVPELAALGLLVAYRGRGAAGESCLARQGQAVGPAVVRLGDPVRPR
jgi:hypothetical protein